MNLEEETNKLKEADTAYYDNDDQVLEDHEYDQLVATYMQLTGEKWVAFGATGTIEHKRPMLSLDKARTLEEVIKFFPDDMTSVHIMPKIDGSSLALWYSKDGDLVRAITRGKIVAGVSYGEDVTEQAKKLKTIPTKITRMGFPVEIRGEVWMSPQNLADANLLRSKLGEEEFKNTRNAASGILRKSSNTQCLEFVNFVAYSAFKQSVPQHEDMWFKNFADQLNWLSDQNFDIPDTICKYIFNLVTHGMAEIEDFMRSCSYPTDGVVLMTTHMDKQRSLGLGSRFPKYALAYKFQTETAQTKILDILWTATRTGMVKPKAIFEPIELDDTTVEQATLHNAKHVQNMGLGIGDLVEVYKSNQIIPQVAKVITSAQQGSSLPVSCPSCQSTLEWSDTNTDLVCANIKCPPKLVDLLVYTGNKKNLDINLLGDAVAETLVEKGLVTSLADLFRLPNKKQELSTMMIDNITFGASRASTLIDGINKSRLKPWHIVLHSLGCPGLGEPECRQIAKKYSLLSLMTTVNEGFLDELQKELVTLKGIGKTTAENFIDWLSHNNDVLTDILFNSGLDTNVIDSSPSTGVLLGNTFCITGTHSVPRGVIEKLITDNGGVLTTSVSKKLSYLVAGTEAGNKLEKATKLGVKVIDEASLRCLIMETL